MKFRWHHPPLGPLGPMMYPPAGRGGLRKEVHIVKDIKVGRIDKQFQIILVILFLVLVLVRGVGRWT